METPQLLWTLCGNTVTLTVRKKISLGSDIFLCFLMCRCGTEEHGLVVDLAVLGLRLDSMILKVFSKINDSMILMVSYYKT